MHRWSLRSFAASTCYVATTTTAVRHNASAQLTAHQLIHEKRRTALASAAVASAVAEFKTKADAKAATVLVTELHNLRGGAIPDVAAYKKAVTALKSALGAPLTSRAAFVPRVAVLSAVLSSGRALFPKDHDACVEAVVQAFKTALNASQVVARGSAGDVVQTLRVELVACMKLRELRPDVADALLQQLLRKPIGETVEYEARLLEAACSARVPSQVLASVRLGAELDADTIVDAALSLTENNPYVTKLVLARLNTAAPDVLMSCLTASGADQQILMQAASRLFPPSIDIAACVHHVNVIVTLLKETKITREEPASAVSDAVAHWLTSRVDPIVQVNHIFGLASALSALGFSSAERVDHISRLLMRSLTRMKAQSATDFAASCEILAAHIPAACRAPTREAHVRRLHFIQPFVDFTFASVEAAVDADTTPEEALDVCSGLLQLIAACPVAHELRDKAFTMLAQLLPQDRLSVSPKAKLRGVVAAIARHEVKAGALIAQRAMAAARAADAPKTLVAEYSSAVNRLAGKSVKRERRTAGASAAATVEELAVAQTSSPAVEALAEDAVDALKTLSAKQTATLWQALARLGFVRSSVASRVAPALLRGIPQLDLDECVAVGHATSRMDPFPEATRLCTAIATRVCSADDLASDDVGNVVAALGAMASRHGDAVREPLHELVKPLLSNVLRDHKNITAHAALGVLRGVVDLRIDHSTLLSVVFGRLAEQRGGLTLDDVRHLTALSCSGGLDEEKITALKRLGRHTLGTVLALSLRRGASHVPLATLQAVVNALPLLSPKERTFAEVVKLCAANRTQVDAHKLLEVVKLLTQMPAMPHGTEPLLDYLPTLASKVDSVSLAVDVLAAAHQLNRADERLLGAVEARVVKSSGSKPLDLETLTHVFRVFGELRRASKILPELLSRAAPQLKALTAPQAFGIALAALRLNMDVTPEIVAVATRLSQLLATMDAATLRDAAMSLVRLKALHDKRIRRAVHEAVCKTVAARDASLTGVVAVHLLWVHAKTKVGDDAARVILIDRIRENKAHISGHASVGVRLVETMQLLGREADADVYDFAESLSISLPQIRAEVANSSVETTAPPPPPPPPPMDVAADVAPRKKPSANPRGW